MQDINRIFFCQRNDLSAGVQFQIVIGIDKHHVLSVRLRHAAFSRRQKPLILFLCDNANTLILFCVSLQNRKGTIRRTVIHTDDLNVLIGLFDKAVQTLGQVLLNIIRRNNKGNHHIFGIRFRRSLTIVDIFHCNQVFDV